MTGLLIASILSGCRPSAEKTPNRLGFEHVEDLTYTLTPEFPYMPVHNLTFPFSIKPIATIPINGVAANAWHIHEHLGTHIDAPNHFDPKGISVDEIPLKDLIVPVEVVDPKHLQSALARGAKARRTSLPSQMNWDMPTSSIFSRRSRGCRLVSMRHKD
jgi:hypothetical protein